MKKNTLLLVTLFLSLVLVGCSHTVPSNNGVLDNNAPNEQADNAPRGKHAADSDETFIVNMIPHHQEAIDSSRIILEKSSNEEIKALAQKIITAQTAEIAMMKERLSEWYPKDALQVDYDHMMPVMGSLEGAELDIAYLEGMITHHEGAIQMANDVLMEAQRRPEVDQLAKDIKETQSEEINEMKEILEGIK